MNRSDRMTWIDSRETAWRIELIAGRWQLSRYSATTEQWDRIGSFPDRGSAIDAAHDSEW